MDLVLAVAVSLVAAQDDRVEHPCLDHPLVDVREQDAVVVAWTFWALYR